MHSDYIFHQTNIFKLEVKTLKHYKRIDLSKCGLLAVINIDLKRSNNIIYYEIIRLIE